MVLGSKDEPVEQLHRKVWQLLCRVEISPRLGSSELIRSINHKLQAVVDRIEDVDAKRHELCGRILELAGHGDVHIRAEDLLRNAGLERFPIQCTGKTRGSVAGPLDRCAFRR